MTLSLLLLLVDDVQSGLTNVSYFERSTLLSGYMSFIKFMPAMAMYSAINTVAPQDTEKMDDGFFFAVLSLEVVVEVVVAVAAAMVTID
jgi:hypothetical protein